MATPMAKLIVALIAGTSVASVVIAFQQGRHISSPRHFGDRRIPRCAVATEDETRGETKAEFLARTKILCDERNLPLDEVKNARDLASVPGCPIVPGRIFRMGRVSDASEDDVHLLFREKNLRTLVDLRSPTELRDDSHLDRENVYSNFTSVIWTGKGLCTREVESGKATLGGKKRRWFFNLWRRRNSLVDEFTDIIDDDEECVILKSTNRKERHFVSLMSKLKYARGVLPRIRKRDIGKALLSRRAFKNVYRVFTDEINEGGLPMLNELILKHGARGINYVLELCADKERHPVSFYCTAGKDRTGIVTAIILSLVGVPEEHIIEDYSLSANVYAEMNDHQAMVGALSQRDLDPETFLRAPPEVMRDVLHSVRTNYGSVEGYLDSIGFGPESQQRLKEALLQ